MKCVYDRVIVVLNADKDKYLNCEKSSNPDTIGNELKYCQKMRDLIFF